MKVYNQEKTQILENYDLEKGHIEQDFIEVPEIQAVEEQGHYETIREYANGGKDVKWVVDVEGVEYQPAHQEKILVYIPYTEKELQTIANQNELVEVMQHLIDTDYVANKLIEAINEEELNQLKQKYAKVLAQRRNWRIKANELKKELEA